MTSTNLASTEADADESVVPAAETGPFVLNLCSSTTPMALAQTELPELKRFTFFVSRRFEEGRERFRLHMGFFETQAEAEEWLNVVREIYPGAWAGEAPGKKLRARAAEAAAAQARHAVGPQKTAAAPAAPPPTPAAPAPTLPARSVARPQSTRPSAPPRAPTLPPRVPTLIPTLHPPVAAPAIARTSAPPAAGAAGRAAAAQPAKAAVPQPLAKRPPAAPPAPRAASPTAARAPAAQNPAAPRPTPTVRPAAATTLPQQPRTGTASVGGQRPAAKPVAPVKPAAPPAVVRVAAASAKPPAAPIAAKAAPQVPSRATQQPAKKPAFADSNVREVMAALDSPGDPTGETRLMPVAVASADPGDDTSLTDTQVLRFLETRREEDVTAPAQSLLQADDAAQSGISLLKPDDTGTRRALKEAVSHNEPVSFAVQLHWSVQPVELEKVPPLAIFSAYTLYSVEGSREGRKWYGLRLGFFNDAISAKQVAYYVRSEFTSVAVVPVSPRERERATEDNQRFAGLGTALKRRDNEDNEFKLIDDAPRAAPAAAASPAATVAPPPRATRQPVPTTRAARKEGAKVAARERRTPQTLEETLEILGANELAIDGVNADSLSDTGVRHLRVEVQKNTPFSRLLERLSERVRKS